MLKPELCLNSFSRKDFKIKMAINHYKTYLHFFVDISPSKSVHQSFFLTSRRRIVSLNSKLAINKLWNIFFKSRKREWQKQRESKEASCIRKAVQRMLNDEKLSRIRVDLTSERTLTFPSLLLLYSWWKWFRYFVIQSTRGRTK